MTTGAVISVSDWVGVADEGESTRLAAVLFSALAKLSVTVGVSSISDALTE
ncbi:hypothetical protein STRDD10_01998 [Streptococcus sp. DD10]|nr:hypothetical protein STRDD10_01998 [Streptococcus sp. DD10]